MLSSPQSQPHNAGPPPAGPGVIDAPQSIPFFQGMDAARIDQLMVGASVARFAKGARLFAAGDMPGHLHILLSGSVEAYAVDGEREHAALIFGPSDLVLPAAALADKPYLLSARALKRTKLLALPAAAVRAEMARCPVLTSRLVMQLAGQLRVTLRHIKDLKTRSGPQRLAAYLLRLVDEQGSAETAELPFSKGVLASRLGMTAESFSRALHTLRDRGMLVRGHRALVRDRAAVERYCQLDPLMDSGEGQLDVRAW